MALTRTTIRTPQKSPPSSFSQLPIHPGSAISATDFSVAEVRRILQSADALERENPVRRADRLAKRRVALLFYESSTRTRTSFELAAKALGADTNARDCYGSSPLHVAVKSGNGIEAEAIFASPKIQTSVQDENDLTPLDWAVAYGHREIASSIRRRNGHQTTSVQS